MLAHRLRLWANINSTLVQRLVMAWNDFKLIVVLYYCIDFKHGDSYFICGRA